MKKLFLVPLIVIFSIIGIYILDASTDLLSVYAVKSRLFPEKEAETVTKISVAPQEVKEGGVIYVKITPGSEGSARSMVVYKIKPGPDIKVENGYRYCIRTGTKCHCVERKCKEDGGYEFSYALLVNDLFGPGDYYVSVVDFGVNAKIIYPFSTLRITGL